MRLIAAIFLAGLTMTASAETTAPPKPCDTPEHRAFDFWVGNWKVSVTGHDDQEAGTNEVKLLHDSCVVEENWVGRGGMTGQSQNVYADGKWHQIWVDNGGGLLTMEGGTENGAMVMTTPMPTDWGANPGDKGLQRITWTPNSDGSVRQHGERSTDGGKTWETNFDLTYRKKG